ncbi:iron-sulfur cluster co-chaperone protein HscB-like [Sceloporus undulatus]|uniref:iron-sulfur cluster co-chaperone protein HscB-like n=1 Tax=Sceloporus undulatus TaxID=8520 RepID=UPI001C4AD09A|nr:iron-sulfur cluster co-chaperone protein HscB-like [Sceloporus undulatus]
MLLEALRRGLLRQGSLLPLTRSLSSAQGGCWSCGTPLSSSASPRFCPSCRALQPPEPGQDHFHLMGCDRSFRLDVPRLQRTFRTLQRSLHPDFFSRRPQVR